MAGRGEQELKDLDTVFKALAHASRRHILIVLNSRGASMTAGEIVKRFSCSWPTTSRHLRLLEEAGLIRVDKFGREWIYSLEKERIHSILSTWLKWFAEQNEEK